MGWRTGYGTFRMGWRGRYLCPRMGWREAQTINTKTELDRQYHSGIVYGHSMKDAPCKWSVVSIDAALIARIVFGPTLDEDACDTAAEAYHMCRALPGEEVHIVCDHHPVVQSIQPAN